MSALDTLAQIVKDALSDPESEQLSQIYASITKILQEEAQFKRENTHVHYLRQGAFVKVESLALRAADHVRILGFDKPIMHDPEYMDVLSYAQNKGVPVEALVNPAHTLDISSLLPSTQTSYRRKISEVKGWRSYNNKLFRFTVTWDSTRRSLVESDVSYRTWESGPTAAPSDSILADQRFDRVFSNPKLSLRL